MLQLVPHDGHYYYLYRQLPETRNRSPTNVTRKLGLAWRFGEPIKRAQAGDAAHRSAAASSNGFEVEEGRGRRYTRSNFFPLFTFFFPLTFCRNAILYSKSTQKKVILFATFIFRENAPSRQSEVIQLLNEFCRIGVAYSLRNFRAKIYSVSKRRQNDGAGQV